MPCGRHARASIFGATLSIGTAHICSEPSGQAAVTIGRVTNDAPEAHDFAPDKRKRTPSAAIRTGSSSCVFQTPKIRPRRASSRAVARWASVPTRAISCNALTWPS